MSNIKRYLDKYKIIEGENKKCYYCSASNDIMFKNDNNGIVQCTACLEGNVELIKEIVK